MGKLGRERVEDELAWEHQAPAYLAVFDELTSSSTGSGSSDLRRKDAR
jgi:hypothetical protein